MGLLDSRIWERLDALDRRTGFRRRWTETSLAATKRILWVMVAFAVLFGVIDIVQSAWVSAVLALSGVVFAVLVTRPVLRTLWERVQSKPSED